MRGCEVALEAVVDSRQRVDAELAPMVDGRRALDDSEGLGPPHGLRPWRRQRHRRGSFSLVRLRPP